MFARTREEAGWVLHHFRVAHNRWLAEIVDGPVVLVEEPLVAAMANRPNIVQAGRMHHRVHVKQSTHTLFKPTSCPHGMTVTSIQRERA